ncbi:MAG: transposase domain-containing protein [Candidatus Binataceae bacterium]
MKLAERALGYRPTSIVELSPFLSPRDRAAAEKKNLQGAATIVVPSAAAAPEFAALPERDREVARARAEILSACQRSPGGIDFEGAVAAGVVGVSAAALRIAHRRSRRSCFRWKAQLKCHNGDPTSLAPQYRHEPKPLRKLPPETQAIYERFTGLYLSRSRRSLTRSWQLAIQAFTGMPWHQALEDEVWRAKIPSLISCRRRFKRETPSAVVIAARHGDQALKQHYPHQRRDHSVFRALEAVNGDGRKSKCYVRWTDGTVSRPVIFSIQDIASGKRLAWRCDKSENREVVRLTLGDLARDFGLPDHFYIDNTRAMANKWLTGRTSFRFRWKVREEDAVGILVALGTRVHFVTPAWGQAKPVERLHRDDIESLDRHPALAGAMAEKNAVPVARFIALMDEVFAAENAQPGRSGRGMNGRSFDTVFQDSFSRGPVRRATEAQLRICMLAADAVRVAPNGEIDFFGNRYWLEHSAPVEGARAIVRFDPAHLHDGVHVYQLDGTYVGHARCLEDAGFNDSGAARELALSRRQWMKAQKQALASARRIDEIAVAQELDGRAAERALPNTRLVTLMDEPRWAHDTRKPAPAPLEYTDRSEIDADYARIMEAVRAPECDLEREVDLAIARYRSLLIIPRANWTADDVEFVSLASGLPEVRALIERGELSRCA